MEPKDDANKDLMLTDVPNYVSDADDQEGEEDEISLKDMLTAMRKEFRSVGKKVDAMEKNLGNTHQDVKNLAGQVKAATVDDDAYKKEARASARNTDAEIQTIRSAQDNFEANRKYALQQLQSQVLSELEEKYSTEIQQRDIPADTAGANEMFNEWVTKERSQPQSNPAKPRSTPLPRRYTEIARKEERTQPQTTNTNSALTLVYVKDWKDESIGVIKNALRT